MRYVSTRGRAPELDFADVLLTGLASDGGLYVPAEWPSLFAGWSDDELSYVDVATGVMWPYVEGSIDRDRFAQLVADAYAGFDDPDVTPMVELDPGLYLLELFRGPTLAFKDIALQLVGRLFEEELTRRDATMTIVAATSGDTGSAAIEACRGRDRVRIFVLHPEGRVSDVQRRQMTTVQDDNIHNLAIDGSFDDCQDLVKAMFADEPFRRKHSLGAVNSINWARVMAQTVYYVYAAARMPRAAPPTFVVPSGNFGNVFAGWVARQMGLPVRRLVVASNQNDILTQFFGAGTMRMGAVEPTFSPAMDIQVSSNLERLLFELFGRDGIDLADAMAAFREAGSIDFGPYVFAAANETFSAGSIDDAATLRVIQATARRSGQVVDPHTAVGLGVAAELTSPTPSSPVVCLATAHPAKFPDAVERATGRRPALPDRLSDLLEREERMTSLPNDLAAVESYIDHTDSGSGGSEPVESLA